MKVNASFLRHFCTALSFAVILTLALPCRADLIFADTTTSNTASDYFPVTSLSTTGGMNLSYGTPGVFDAADRPTQIAGTINAWVTADHGNLNPTYQDYYFGATAGVTPVLTFSFAAAKDLEALSIWNYPADGGGLRGCAKTIDIAVDKGSGFGTILTGVTLTKGNALSTVADVIPIGTQTGVIAVRLTITDNYFDGVAAGGDRVGLGKVAFNTAGSSVPLDFRITAFSYDQETGEISLTWNSVASADYSIFYGSDPSNLTEPVATGIPGDAGQTTYSFSTPVAGAAKLFFRVEDGS